MDDNSANALRLHQFAGPPDLVWPSGPGPTSSDPGSAPPIAAARVTLPPIFGPAATGRSAMSTARSPNMSPAEPAPVKLSAVAEDLTEARRRHDAEATAAPAP